jgi:photosystem II stability/assembly factor-like uncharacterized protein
VAPGAEIRSTVPKSMWEPGYFHFSGTSMAAPHVAGAAALMQQLHPGWSVEDVKSVLVGYSHPLQDYDALTQGAGRLDLTRAADATVVARPAALSLGLADLSAPSFSDGASFSLTNLGTQAVTASLSVRKSAGSAGDVGLSQSDVTIPAGGDASVTLSVSSSRPETDQDISGWVEVDLAKDGSVDLRVPYELAVRYMRVYASPDPTTASTEAFIYAPSDLAAPPQLVVTGPRGYRATYTPKLDHRYWWRVPIQGSTPGVYQMEVSGKSAADFGGVTLKGTGAFEVVAAGSGAQGASRWRSIGPNSNGGKMVFDPKGSKRLMVVPEDQATVFLSDDGAQTWREMRTMPLAFGHPIEAVADPTNGDRAYIAMSEGRAFGLYEGAILTTDDGGKSWTTLDFPNVEVTGLAIDGSGRLLAATGADSVYVSRDRGATWESIPTPWGYTSDAAFSGGDLYVGGFAGLYVFRDIAAGIDGPHKVLGKAVTSLAADDSAIVADTGYSWWGSEENPVFISRDRGAHFTPVFNQPGFRGSLKLIGGDIYLTMYDDVWVGRNYGAEWKKYPGDPSGEFFKSEAGRWPGGDAGRVIASSPGRGIFDVTTSGETRIGVPGVSAYDVAVTRDADGRARLVAGTPWEVYSTVLPRSEVIDASTFEWGFSGYEQYFGTVVPLLATDPSNDRVVYKVRRDAVSGFWIYRSTDGGREWDALQRSVEAPTALAVHPNDPKRVYVGYWRLYETGVLYTEDGGQTWRKSKRPVPPLALAGDPRNANRLYLGDRDGLYVSEDGGQTFRRLANTPVSAIGIDPRNPDHLVFGGKHLYESRDGGRTITPASYGPLTLSVREVAFSPTTPGTVYVATGSHMDGGIPARGRGVLVSADGGRSWRSFSLGLDNLNATSLAFSADGRYLFAGTEGGGVYRIKLPYVDGR